MVYTWKSHMENLYLCFLFTHMDLFQWLKGKPHILTQTWKIKKKRWHNMLSVVIKCLSVARGQWNNKNILYSTQGKTIIQSQHSYRFMDDAYSASGSLVQRLAPMYSWPNLALSHCHEIINILEQNDSILEFWIELYFI